MKKTPKGSQQAAKRAEVVAEHTGPAIAAAVQSSPLSVAFNRLGNTYDFNAFNQIITGQCGVPGSSDLLCLKINNTVKHDAVILMIKRDSTVSNVARLNGSYMNKIVVVNGGCHAVSSGAKRDRGSLVQKRRDNFLVGNQHGSYVFYQEVN